MLFVLMKPLIKNLDGGCLYGKKKTWGRIRLDADPQPWFDERGGRGQGQLVRDKDLCL